MKNSQEIAKLEDSEIKDPYTFSEEAFMNVFTPLNKRLIMRLNNKKI